MNPYLHFADLRGLSRLVFDTTGGITDLVEDMHQTISAPFSLLPAGRQGRTSGITGLVYRSIHAGYGVVGGAIDLVLAPLAAAFDGSPNGDTPSSPERETMLAVVNGIWGDHLAAGDNPLAIDMALRYGGRSLSLEKGTLRGEIPEASGKLLVLVHGLCMSDLGWSRAGHDHGAAPARDLGFTPLYLRYNSGLHVSTNGRGFAGLLGTLIDEWPQPVEELAIVGYSMGGLVARSALYYATLAGHAWPRYLRKLICLGTPHHGSSLERIGNWTGGLLKVTRYTAPFRRLGTHRSAGITDLRYGNLIDEDWAGRDRFALDPDLRRHVPLPAGIAHYAIAATLCATPDDLKGSLIGDGFVPLASALGRHRDPQRCLAFPQSQQWVGYGMSHLDLLGRAEVYAQIRAWLAA